MNKICIIIPCYNESQRMSQKHIIEFLELHKDCSLLLVDDGSSDNTFEILKSIAHKFPDRAEAIQQLPNKGKAEAVRLGMQHALSKDESCLLGYFDADFSTPLDEISLLRAYLEAHPTALMSFGSRWKRMGAVIKRSPARHYFGRGFATMASLLLGLPIYDTQCGAKLMSRECAAIAFKEPFISRWLFDVEVFARLIRQFGRPEMRRRLCEVPLNVWVEVGDSRIKPSFILKVPFELIRIKRKYKI